MGGATRIQLLLLEVKMNFSKQPIQYIRVHLIHVQTYIHVHTYMYIHYHTCTYYRCEEREHKWIHSCDAMDSVQKQSRGVAYIITTVISLS